MSLTKMSENQRSYIKESNIICFINFCVLYFCTDFCYRLRVIVNIQNIKNKNGLTMEISHYSITALFYF